ncbi:MAG: hypothetical protein JSV68_18580 [Anaerolineaceae bacterium]|nr:MAG: hypothetical protein JSV68_18580 [Anaerolineaceae bacterium]
MLTDVNETAIIADSVFGLLSMVRAQLYGRMQQVARNEPYKELGGDYFNNRRKEVRVNVLTKQLEKLGYAVQLEPAKPQLEPA